MKALNKAIKAVGRSMWVDQLDTGAHLILRHWSEAAFGGWVGEMGMRLQMKPTWLDGDLQLSGEKERASRTSKKHFSCYL